MTEISRNNWTFGAQIVTAVGMFIVTLGILFIGNAYLPGSGRSGIQE